MRLMLRRKGILANDDGALLLGLGAQLDTRCKALFLRLVGVDVEVYITITLKSFGELMRILRMNILEINLL